MPKVKVAAKAFKRTNKPARQVSDQSSELTQADSHVHMPERKPKVRRFRPGTVALREIRYYQSTIGLLLPMAPFQRVVRAICAEIDPDLRFQS